MHKENHLVRGLTQGWGMMEGYSAKSLSDCRKTNNKLVKNVDHAGLTCVGRF